MLPLGDGEPFVSVGIRPVSLHRRGDRLGARVLSAGETQRQVNECNSLEKLLF